MMKKKIQEILFPIFKLHLPIPYVHLSMHGCIMYWGVLISHRTRKITPISADAIVNKLIQISCANTMSPIFYASTK